MSDIDSNSALTLASTATVIRHDAPAQSYLDAMTESPPADRTRFFRWKYRFDRVAATILLVLFAPLTAMLCLMVVITSPGPALYRQVRVGLNGKCFEILKLRSMFQDAEKNGYAVWCIKNDPRITWFGRFLRKFHLDELPQLLNVARGEMSFVGPRPERPEICEKLAEEIDGYYQRVTVKPGVTGLAQINLPPDQEVEDAMRKQILDVCYIQQANAWLDARMLIATALRMLGIKGEIVMRLMSVCRRNLVREHRLQSAEAVQGRQFFERVESPWEDEPPIDQETEFPMAGFGTETQNGSSDPRQPR